MSTHKAAATTSKGVFEIIDVPTQAPGPGEVQVKVAYAAFTPPDVYITDQGHFVQEYPTVLGLASSGVIAAVGPGVTNFAVGDRVLGFNPPGLGLKGKGAQEIVVCQSAYVGKIPEGISLADAATVPDNLVCAYYTITACLGLPLQEDGDFGKAPFVVYGAGATSGQYAIQLLARVGGVKNIVAVASPAHNAYLKSIGASAVVDYRAPDAAEQILKASGGKAKYIIDPIATKSSLALLAKVAASDAKVAVLIPIKVGIEGIVGAGGQTDIVYEIPKDMNSFPSSAELVLVRTFLYDQDDDLKQNLMTNIVPVLLKDKIVEPSRKHLIDSDSLSFKEKVTEALDLYRHDRVRGVKVIVKVQDV